MERPVEGAKVEVLSLEDVWKAYQGEEYVLKGVELSVGTGEFVGIHGRSGSGKSTLLRLMGLLDTPTRGRVSVLGKDVTSMRGSEASKVRLEKIGFIFQGLNLIPHITAAENIEVPMWMKGVGSDERKEKALHYLKHFELTELADRYPSQMSHGEQQRVAAIRAIVNQPSVILADEPTSHLDDESARVFLELVARFNRELGTTIVMVSTSPDEARIGRSVYALSKGLLSRESPQH